MPRTLRISEDAARVALGWIPERSDYPADQAARRNISAALARLDRVPKSRPKSKKTFRPPGIAELASAGAPAYVALKTWAEGRKTEKTLAKARRQDIRTAVFLRADGRCEGPQDHDPLSHVRCGAPAAELQHVFGRGKGRIPESERNCLAACHDCHLAETRNQPSSEAWWAYFAWWFWKQGFGAEAREAEKRRDVDAVKANLPAAPRANRHE